MNGHGRLFAGRPVLRLALAAAVAAAGCLVGCTQTVSTQAAPGATPAETLDRAKAYYGFTTWPGKNGKLRPGTDAAKALAPLGIRLRLLWVHEPRGEASGLAPESAELTWSNMAEPKVEVRMWISSSCNDAHEIMIRRLAGGNIGIVPRTRGKDVGIALGDVSFVGAAGTQFVRNNLFVDIRDYGKRATQIGKALDRALLRHPARASLDAQRPRIRRLALAPGVVEPINPLRGTAPLTVDAWDPSGGRLVLRWAHRGPVNGVREVKPGKFVFAPDNTYPRKGRGVNEGKIVLTAVSLETGLYTTAELSVKVRERKPPS